MTIKLAKKKKRKEKRKIMSRIIDGVAIQIADLGTTFSESILAVSPKVDDVGISCDPAVLFLGIASPEILV